MNEDNQTPPIQPETPAPVPIEPNMVSPQPVVSPLSQVVVSSHQNVIMKWFKKPLVMIVVAVIVILAVAGGLVFGLYLPNTPNNVYSSGLANTGKAEDELIRYATDQTAANYKSATFDGTLKFKSSDGSYDVTLNGASDTSSNTTATVKADILGENLTADVRSVLASGNKTPDVYFRVTGIKTLLDTNGLASLDGLDNQWVAVDHTLIDTYASSLQKSVGTDISSASNLPTKAQLTDAAMKIATVNKTYLYTTDAKTAVLANETYIGQEKDGDRTLNHYTVGYDKSHLQAYVSALATALDSSSLNTWSKAANNGKNLSQLLDFDSLKSDIQGARTDYTFNLWIDTGTKLVSKVQLTDPSDSASVVTLSQSYAGGSSYPVSITIKDKDDSGNPETGTIGVIVHTDTHKVNFTVAFDSKASTGETTVDAALNVTPSNTSVSVTAPTGAKSVVDILSELGLGGDSSSLLSM